MRGALDLLLDSQPAAGQCHREVAGPVHSCRRPRLALPIPAVGPSGVLPRTLRRQHKPGIPHHNTETPSGRYQLVANNQTKLHNQTEHHTQTKHHNRTQHNQTEHYNQKNITSDPSGNAMVADHRGSKSSLSDRDHTKANHVSDDNDHNQEASHND